MKGRAKYDAIFDGKVRQILLLAVEDFDYVNNNLSNTSTETEDPSSKLQESQKAYFWLWMYTQRQSRWRNGLLDTVSNDRLCITQRRDKREQPTLWLALKACNAHKNRVDEHATDDKITDDNE